MQFLLQMFSVSALTTHSTRRRHWEMARSTKRLVVVLLQDTR